ncbi:ATPase [Candidatus Pacearchaeota archaeon]|nr:ATPase [Candidatus Pacearchaeota archaeon]
MEKAEIIEILEDWNFWNKEHDVGIIREDYLKRIEKLAETKQVIAIMGARRSGKSTIMLQYLKRLVTERNIDPKNTLYVNFEDLRFKKLDLDLLNKIYETYIEYKQPSSKPFIFLDELHNIGEWERFARTKHELKEAMIFISSSNEKLLSGKLASLLTGRHLDIHVFPLDFKEFLRFKEVYIKGESDLISKRRKIKSLLNEYLEYGGFPLIVLQESKEELLKTYFEDIINKDVIEYHTINHVTKIKSLAKFYLTNVGRRISFNKISKLLSLSLDTIERYSYYLEEAYLIKFIKKFSYSVKDRERTMSVVYVIDNGIRNLLGFKFSKDSGWLYQNAVANYLMRKYDQEGIFYWMNSLSEEVDFVVKKGLKVKQLIQVCYDLSNNETKEREIKSLLKSSKELKCNNLLIITDEKEGEEKIRGKRIKYISLWKWLLK